MALDVAQKLVMRRISEMSDTRRTNLTDLLIKHGIYYFPGCFSREIGHSFLADALHS